MRKSDDLSPGLTDSPEKNRLQAKGKQLKLLMAFMLTFMVLGPLLGPTVFADEFSQLHGVGLYIFYVGTPVIFGAMFLFYLILHRRIEKKLRGKQ
jgi:hypothetical protein